MIIHFDVTSCNQVVPVASMLTPNQFEAEQLTGFRYFRTLQVMLVKLLWLGFVPMLYFSNHMLMVQKNLFLHDSLVCWLKNFWEYITMHILANGSCLLRADRAFSLQIVYKEAINYQVEAFFFLMCAISWLLLKAVIQWQE